MQKDNSICQIDFSQKRWIYFTYPSGRKPAESVKTAWKMTGQPSVDHIQSREMRFWFVFFYCQLSQVAVAHGFFMLGEATLKRLSLLICINGKKKIPCHSLLFLVQKCNKILLISCYCSIHANQQLGSQKLLLPSFF